jgi:hypothetical protein
MLGRERLSPEPASDDKDHDKAHRHRGGDPFDCVSRRALHGGRVTYAITGRVLAFGVALGGREPALLQEGSASAMYRNN